MQIANLNETIAEANRQVDICNACRYCEGFCSVFPAINREREFFEGDIIQLANLCHNCRGCYYACQYTAPHEFDLNLPKILAETRQQSWQEFTLPSFAGKWFHKSGTIIALFTIIMFAMLFWVAKTIGAQAGGEGFYAILSHNLMVAIFAPAFLFPILSIFISICRYWKSVGGGAINISDFINAIKAAGNMKNLSGGHGEGCNFEDEDRFSKARKTAHHFVMYGFLLCFASTSVATIMHYVFDMPAPYPLFSLPKLFGIIGGVLLSIGTLVMAMLKLKAERSLSDVSVWGGEMGFIVLLFLVSTTGLLLYFFNASVYLTLLLTIHLGTVLSFFLLMPYSKMVHGFYRLAALVKDEQQKRLHK